VGTGNYNPKTARLYEDFGLLTCDPQVGEDLTRLFNQLSGWAPRSRFKRLLVAPRSVRWGLIDHIDAEIENVREGLGGYVGFKLNSIVDDQMIDALYRASRAGVKVDLWVRGICALRPGVKGLSENIRVRSILGRFLEHSRVFVFGGAGEPVVFIGSADLMHRNLDRRVEALVRLTDQRHVSEMKTLMSLGMSDEISSWHLSGDGRWTRHCHDGDGKKLNELQTMMIENNTKRRRKARRTVIAVHH
jgi:polyphosphate kinase